MAGHSKWDNIKHRKGAQDAKRAKVFAKLSKEITVAALSGAPDPAINASLRLAISKARAKSMPKKNIEGAIDKAKGNTGGSNFKELVYGANVNGVSFIIASLTDNQNRTSSLIQHIISKAGGSVSSSSSVSYIFDRKGVLEIDSDSGTEEQIMEKALLAGAEDFEVEDGSYYIYTTANDFSEVKDNLEKENIHEFKTAEVKYIPNQEIFLPKEKAMKILNLIDKLEDDDDVQDVHHNLDAASLK